MRAFLMFLVSAVGLATAVGAAHEHEGAIAVMSAFFGGYWFVRGFREFFGDS